MPTYDYECDKCGVFEEFQMMSAKKFTECPKCGSKKIKRLIGAGMGIIFKGTGFYETDYKRKENSTKSKTCRDGSEICTQQKTESKSETKIESKSESKPESKPESKQDSKK